MRDKETLMIDGITLFHAQQQHPSRMGGSREAFYATRVSMVTQTHLREDLFAKPSEPVVVGVTITRVPQPMLKESTWQTRKKRYQEKTAGQFSLVAPNAKMKQDKR